MQKENQKTGPGEKPCYQRRQNPKKKNLKNYKEFRTIAESLIMYPGERKGENENSGKSRISEKQDSSQELIFLEEK